MKTITKWKRTCPKCNTLLYYLRSGSLAYANKINSYCKPCGKLGKGKIYKFNRNILQTINTSSKAYLMGWLATDGFIKLHVIGISLKESDSYIVNNMFRNVFGNDIPNVSHNQSERYTDENGMTILERV